MLELPRLDRPLGMGLGGADFRRRRLTRGLGELAGRFSLYLANRFFEREALAGDVGFIKRGGEPTQLSKQGRARAFVKRSAVLAAVLIENGDGACNEGVIIGHGTSA